MSTIGRKYCIFGCVDLGAYMHRFPHPIKRSEMFEKWVSVAGNKLTKDNPLTIFKNKKVCDFHFTSDVKVGSHRLTHLAVPSKNLEGVLMSPGIKIALEHNYSFPGLQSSKPRNEENTCNISSDIPIATDHNSCLHHIYINSEHISEKNISTQIEIRKLKSELRKSKKRESKYKIRLKEMKKTLSHMKMLL